MRSINIIESGIGRHGCDFLIVNGYGQRFHPTGSKQIDDLEIGKESAIGMEIVFEVIHCGIVVAVANGCEIDFGSAIVCSGCPSPIPHESCLSA